MLTFKEKFGFCIDKIARRISRLVASNHYYTF